MDSVTVVAFAILSGMICFIAGMVVELFINNRELMSARTELSCAKDEIISLKHQLSEGVEVIEINDNRTKDEDLFEPW